MQNKKKKQKFRITNDSSEIYFFLKDLKKDRGNVKAGIKLEANLESLPALMTGINLEERELTLILDKEQEILENSQVQVLFEEEKFNTIFNIKIVNFDGRTITASFPREIHTVENRSLHRRKVQISPVNIISVALRCPILISPLVADLNLLDLSPDGASMVSDSQVIKYLEVNELIHVKKIGQNGPNIDKKARVVYIRPFDENYKINNQNSYRIGLNFQENLGLEIFNYLQL